MHGTDYICSYAECGIYGT